MRRTSHFCLVFAFLFAAACMEMDYDTGFTSEADEVSEAGEVVVVETCEAVDSDMTEAAGDSEIVSADGELCPGCYCNSSALAADCQAKWPGSQLDFSAGNSGNCSNSMCRNNSPCNTGTITCVRNGQVVGTPVGAAPLCETY